MALRKLVFLTQSVYCKTVKLQSPKLIRQNVWILSANFARYFSDNIEDKKENVKESEKVDILGRLFPPSQTNAKDVQEIKKEQEKFKQEQKEKSKENEKSLRRMKINFAVFGGAMIVMSGWMVIEMGASRRGDDGQPLEDEFSHLPLPLQYLRRTWKELTFDEKMIKEPSREKLLPDPLPAPYQPTYTLVLEFTDVLAHPEWSYQTGWRFKKRPGLDHFLQTVDSSDYEIVIFTSENVYAVWLFLDNLDPEAKIITYRLFRDSTQFIDGVHVKNIARLNRDLSKVIVIDCNKMATKFQPENAIILKKWKGDDDDTALLDLATLLQTIAMSNVADVREVLRYYSQFEDPIAAFRDNQRRLMEQMAERERDRSDTSAPLTGSWLRPFTRR